MRNRSRARRRREKYAKLANQEIKAKSQPQKPPYRRKKVTIAWHENGMEISIFHHAHFVCECEKREKILARKLFCAPQKKHTKGGMVGGGRKSQSGKMNEQEISEFNDSEINENLVFRYFIHGARSFGDEERLLWAARDGKNWGKTFSFSKVLRLGLRSESRTLQRDYDEIKCRKNKAEWNFLLKKKKFSSSFLSPPSFVVRVLRSSSILCRECLLAAEKIYEKIILLCFIGCNKMSIKTEHPTCSEVFSGRWHWNSSCHHLHRNQIVLLIFNNFSIESLVKKRGESIFEDFQSTRHGCVFFTRRGKTFIPLRCFVAQFSRSPDFLSLLYRIEFCRILSSSHHRSSGGCRKENTERSVGDFCTIEKLFPATLWATPRSFQCLAVFVFTENSRSWGSKKDDEVALRWKKVEDLRER